MKTVRLGKTGLEVSKIGIGGIPLTRPSEAEAVRVVQRALDLGVNFIDTAAGYTTSEERIGKAIAGRRDQVIIATKGGWDDKAMVVEHMERSLKRLNTNYIDLWQFHGVNSFEEYEHVLKPGGVMEAVQGALDKGKIRHIGLSSHSLEVAKRAVTSGHFETILVPFNFVNNSAADELVSLAHGHDVGFIAMKPFEGGMLDNANLVFKYFMQFDNVVPIPGVEKVEEIEEIVGIVNGSWELTPQELQDMADIRARMGSRFCRRCQYCMPCAQGVNIQPLMTLPALWKLWPPERFLTWTFVSDTVKSAENCIQCGECEAKCPYHLPIREIMTENIAFYERVTAA